jgi:hypothetical protein
MKKHQKKSDQPPRSRGSSHDPPSHNSGPTTPTRRPAVALSASADAHSTTRSHIPVPRESWRPAQTDGHEPAQTRRKDDLIASGSRLPVPSTAGTSHDILPRARSRSDQSVRSPRVRDSVIEDTRQLGDTASQPSGPAIAASVDTSTTSTSRVEEIKRIFEAAIERLDPVPGSANLPPSSSAAPSPRRSNSDVRNTQHSAHQNSSQPGLALDTVPNVFATNTSRIAPGRWIASGRKKPASSPGVSTLRKQVPDTNKKGSASSAHYNPRNVPRSREGLSARSVSTTAGAEGTGSPRLSRFKEDFGITAPPSAFSSAVEPEGSKAGASYHDTGVKVSGSTNNPGSSQASGSNNFSDFSGGNRFSATSSDYNIQCASSSSRNRISATPSDDPDRIETIPRNVNTSREGLLGSQKRQEMLERQVQNQPRVVFHILCMCTPITE